MQHTLDNKSTKKYLLKSKGRTLDDVSSKMKLIESSLGLDTGSRTDLQDINGVILELEGEIKVKENQISEYDRNVMCSIWCPLLSTFYSQVVPAAQQPELPSR